MIEKQRLICSILTYNVKWNVYLIDRDNPILNTANARYDGVTVYHDHTIYISDGLDETATKETVYHEVTHAFNHSLYGHKTNLTDEDLCNFIGCYGRNIYNVAETICEKIIKLNKKSL